MAELPGDLVTEAGGAQGWNRQAASGDHQRCALHLAHAGLQQVAGFELLDMGDRGIHAQVDLDLLALGQQQAENVAGLVIAEQLAELFLVVRHVVLAHQFDKIPLGITRQGRFAEVRILREEIARLCVHVGEIAAATTGHQDFLAGLVGMVE
ncbi:hypothetical protein D9M71_427070 [compost metagenome]